LRYNVPFRARIYDKKLGKQKNSYNRMFEIMVGDNQFVGCGLPVGEFM
jgi:hypothetical protein